MPATTSHPHTRQPQIDSVVVLRYMDVPKLCYTLTTGLLPMVNLRRFDDTAEGRFLEVAVEPVLDVMGTRIETTPKDAESLNRLTKAMSETCRRDFFVSSWCASHEESEALWRLYGRECGVALRSTYGKLKAALPEFVYLGLVEYIDYRSPGHIIPLNMFAPVMRKQVAFRHEQECRVIAFGADPTKLKAAGAVVSPDCISIPFDITAGVDELVVSPYAPSWTKPVITGLVDKFAPGLRISSSSLVR